MPGPTLRVKQITLDSLINKKPYTRPAAPVKRNHDDDDDGVTVIERPDAGAGAFVLGKVPPPFPLSVLDRNAFRRPKSARKVTEFQWKLYDLLLTVPPGRVSTYGQLAKLLGSSARAVGSALRENPFAPYVPCHRVIASTLYIGGFGGEWLPSAATLSSSRPAAEPASEAKKSDKKRPPNDGSRTNEKLELLRREGVRFDSKGFLADKTKLWEGQPTASWSAAVAEC
ncbi:hypothetical protein JCM3774_005484 [Rhodotorula dairenensis]